MTIRFLFISFTLLVAFNTLFGQMQKVDFVKYQLDNGLTVLLHEDHVAPIVAVNVMYHVGSKNEKPERTGFAHFFEHLMFEGSKNIERGQFDVIADAAGAEKNAGTTQDYTIYYEVLPSNHLATALWLESERMLHAKVDKVGIETQREVVKEERRMRVDNQPYGRFNEEIFKRMYKKHPYQWSIIGSMEHLDAAQEADYQQFYADFYVPNNAVLSIAGDIDIEETKKLVKKYFGTIPKGKKPVYRPSIQEPPLNGELRDTVYDNIQLPAVFIAYHAPAEGTPDYYAMEMLNKVLSDGQSSRIYRSLVDEKRLAIQAQAFAYALEDSGLNILLALANVGLEPALLEEAIDEEVEKIKSELITEREFQKVRNLIENDFVFNIASVSGIATNLATYETIYGDANLINTEIDKYLAVTREDIKRVANKYLNKENRLVLYWLAKQQ